jgi:hypothetical protein
VISGPGTGTSDSIPGVVTDGTGKVTRGIAVSDGEGIVTAKATKGLGSETLHKINTASAKTLGMMKAALQGYRAGGVVSPVGNSRRAAAGAAMALRAPLMMAGGGVVRSIGDVSKDLKIGGSHTTVEHNLQTNVNVKADEDSGLDQDTLRRLDDGINLKIQDYVEEQLRPGGLLQRARGR